MKKKTNLSNIIVTTYPSEKKASTTTTKWKPSFPLREDWGKKKDKVSKRGRRKSLKRPRRRRLLLPEKMERWTQNGIDRVLRLTSYLMNDTKQEIVKVRKKIKTLKTKSAKDKWRTKLKELRDNLKVYKQQRNSILYPKGDYIDTPFNEEDKEWGGITFKNFVDEFKGKPLHLIFLSDTETNHFESFVNAYFNGNRAWAEKAYEEGLELYYKEE